MKTYVSTCSILSVKSAVLFFIITIIIIINVHRLSLLSYSYTEDGHTVGHPTLSPPNPIKLQWEITEEVSYLGSSH